MVKRISFFVMMFAVCIFAENIAETKPAVAETAPEPIATEVAPAVETEAIKTEQVAEEIVPAAPVVVETPAPAPAPAPAPPAPAATGSAKEAIIESPLEFAIVTAVFIATVLLITLTGN